MEAPEQKKKPVKSSTPVAAKSARPTASVNPNPVPKKGAMQNAAVGSMSLNSFFVKKDASQPCASDGSGLNEPAASGLEDLVESHINAVSPTPKKNPANSKASKVKSEPKAASASAKSDTARKKRKPSELTAQPPKPKAPIA